MVGVVVQNRKALRGLDADAVVAACVRVHWAPAEISVHVGVHLVELCGCAEAVYKRRKASFAIGVGQQMECLDALR